MGWFGLIRAALEAIISIPKIWDRFLTQNINGRLQKLEENHSKFEAAYKLASEAKTTEEKLNAADAIASAWLSR